MNETSAPKKLKTRAQAKADFRRRGVSFAAWCREHNLRASLVYDILSGNKKRRCNHGQSHRIAVLLGLKEGFIPETPPEKAIK